MISVEFYNVLGSILESNPELKNKTLEIKVNDPAIGPVAAVSCDGVYPGFDWDAGRIIIYSKERIWKEKEMLEKLKKNRTYKIISCTDFEGKEKPGYKHRVGRIVAEPVLDERLNQAWMQYLYDNEGNKMRYGQMLKTSTVSEIVRTFNRKKTMIIKTENTIYKLEKQEKKHDR